MECNSMRKRHVTARTRIALVARIDAKKWSERWSNGYSFVLEATEFALISFFGQAAENQGSSNILRPALVLVVSASASVLVGREFSAGSYQDLINWYCSLLTRCTVYGRAAGNTSRTQKQTE